MYIIKAVKTKTRKQKLWFLLYIPPFNFYFNFPFLSITFQKENLFMNSKHIYDGQKITWMNVHKIQKFICIQTCDRPNFFKKERKQTFTISTQKGGVRWGVVKICHVFLNSNILNNCPFLDLLSIFADGGSGRLVLLVILWGRD